MKTALIIGAGPAGLMAADVLSKSGVSVTICDAKPSVGRKFLMAGKSGLNLTKEEPFEPFVQNYFEASESLRPMIAEFDATAVKHWAQSLGQEMFTGSTGRVFPKAMKASPLLRAWLSRLDAQGVVRRTRWRWLGWENDEALFDTPDGPQNVTADVVVLALGGASWSRLGSDGRWADVLAAGDCALAPFEPSNAGLSVKWSPHMAPFLGSALKAVAWRAGALTSQGEAVLSARGLEGGGIYALTPALRTGDSLYLDLAPDVSADKMNAMLSAKSEKLRLVRWLKNTLRLPPVKTALFFEMSAGETLNRDSWVHKLKNLPVRHDGLRPLDEAISTAGGVSFEALTEDLMLKTRPGVFCAGEMIDWEAPTGGYLITACLATGKWAGRAALRYLAVAA